MTNQCTLLLSQGKAEEGCVERARRRERYDPDRRSMHDDEKELFPQVKEEILSYFSHDRLKSLLLEENKEAIAIINKLKASSTASRNFEEDPHKYMHNLHDYSVLAFESTVGDTSAVLQRDETEFDSGDDDSDDPNAHPPTPPPDEDALFNNVGEITIVDNLNLEQLQNELDTHIDNQLANSILEVGHIEAAAEDEANEEAKQQGEPEGVDTNHGRRPSKYHLWDKASSSWIDTRVLISQLNKHCVKSFTSKDRRQRIINAARSSGAKMHLSFGFPVASSDDKDNMQSFGLGSIVSVTFQCEGVEGHGYRFYLGKVVRILMLPPKGKKHLICCRVPLTHTNTEHMYLSVNWLEPILLQECLASILSATTYRLGPTSDNTHVVHAKYVINVPKVTKDGDVYSISVEEAAGLRDYVKAAFNADKSTQRDSGVKRKVVDRVSTQYSDDPGEYATKTVQTRAGRSSKQPIAQK